MKDDKLFYHYKAVTPSDFECSICMQTDNRLLLNIYHKARQKLARKHSLRVSGDPEVIEKFDIPEMYYKGVRMAIRKAIAFIRKEINQDNIEIVSYKVTSGKFVRDTDNKDKWNIEIEIEGIYAEK